MTELVGRAEDAGLVMRHLDPWDARVAWITLTDRAERQLAAAMEDMNRAEMSRERERLAALLSQLG